MAKRNRLRGARSRLRAQRKYLAVAAATLICNTASAILTWDPNGLAAGTGGTNNWNTTSNFWFNGATFSHQAWSNASPHLGIFDGTAGTVSLTVPITATNGLQFDTAGYVIQNNTLTLGGTITANQDATITSAMAGSGFSKNGSATLTLQGGSSVTGAITVQAGTLQVNNSSALGNTAGATVVNAGATLALNANVTSETLNLSGTGVGGTSGALRAISSGATWSGTIVLSGDSTIRADGNFQHNGPLSASSTGNLTVTGAGITLLNFDNSGFTRDITIDGALLRANHPAALGSGSTFSFSGNGGTLNVTTTLVRGGSIVLGGNTCTFTIGTNNQATVSGNISGAGLLHKNGAGVLVLSGANTYGGGTELALGTISVDSLARLPGLLTVSGSSNTFLNFTETTSGSLLAQLDATAPWSVAGTKTVSITGGQINGTAGLTKGDTGTLVLSTANSYAGDTTVSAGTLVVAHGNALGSAAGGVMVNSGATLQLADGVTVFGEFIQFSGAGVGGNGALRLLSGNATWSDGLAPIAATGGTVGVDSGTLTFAGSIQGIGAMTKVGAGKLILNGTSSFSGAANINAGTITARNNMSFGANGGGVFVASGARLELDNNVVILGEGLSIGGSGIGGNGAMASVGGTSTWGGTVTMTANTAFGAELNSTLVLGGSIGGSFNVSKVGFGTVVLNGTNSYIGSTAVNEGTLVARGVASLGSSGNSVAVNLGILAFEADAAIPQSITIGTAFSQASLKNLGGSNTLNGMITFASDATFATDAGELIVNAPINGGFRLFKQGPAVLELRGVNTYSGGTSLEQGTLIVRSGSTLGASGGTLQLFGHAGTSVLQLDASQTVSALSGTVSTGSATINLSAADVVLTINQSTTTTFAGTLSGAGGIEKSGSGVLRLTGNNSHAGTSVSGGVLIVGANSLGSGTVGIGSGGALVTLAAVSRPGSDLAANPGGATFDSNGFNSTFRDLIGTGTLTKNAGGNLTVRRMTVASVNVAAGRITVTGGGGAGTSEVETIAAAGDIDLRDNKLIVSAMPVGAYSGTNYDGVSGLIATNRIMSTLESGGLTALAVAAAGDVGKTSFGGVSVSPSDVLVMFTYAGDTNLSGSVDADDYFAIDSNYNKLPSTLGFFKGDLNLDGAIDGDDYLLIDSSFSGQGGPFASATAVGVTAVPEPACGLAIAVAFVRALRPRRRRHHCPTGGPGSGGRVSSLRIGSSIDCCQAVSLACSSARVSKADLS